MALKDCITKMGKNLSKDQISALEEAKESGLSDNEAVRSVLLMAHKNVVDIASVARDKGAKLAPVKNPVTDAAQFQSKALQKIADRKTEINKEVNDLKEDLTDITSLEDHIADMGIDLTDDKRVLDGMTSMMFSTDDEARTAFGLTGDSAPKMFDSFRGLQAKKPAIEAEIKSLTAEKDSFDSQVDSIFSGVPKQTLMQENRGAITFYENQAAIIRLTKAKNMSTFLHEGAHLYLEMIGDVAEMADASQRLTDDYTKILGYLGVASREEIGPDQHELFARSWEAYLREGKAPTTELKTMFATASGWMLGVYRVISKLLSPNEALNDDIRGVFDRMMASDEAIKRSEASAGYVALYSSPEDMGVTQRVFNAYRDEMNVSHVEAMDLENKKMIQALTWANQQWWKDELKKFEAEVRSEAEVMPVYRALYMLQRGTQTNGKVAPGIEPFKLNKESVLRVAQGSQEFLNKLPRPFIYAAKGGVDIEEAAVLFGFASGTEMLGRIRVAPNMESFIKAEARVRMETMHPDPMGAAEAVDDTTRAVHNEHRGKVLAKELRAARKKIAADRKIVSATKKDIADSDKQAREANKGQLPKREDMAAIRQTAKVTIGELQISELNPNEYLNAERKAGRLAFEANGRKDYQKAYDQKRRQILYFEAYRAAVRAKKANESTQKYVKSFDKKPKRTRMGKAGVLDKIDAILENISFRNVSKKSISPSNVDRINLETELLAAVEEGSLIMPPGALESMTHPEGINWRQLSSNELADIRDVLKQLEHSATIQYKALVNDEQVKIREKAGEIADSLIDNNKEMIPSRKGETDWERRKRGGRDAVGHWLRPATIARILDKSGFGAVTRNIIVPIRRAYAEKLLPRTQEATETVAKIYTKHYSNAELVRIGKPLPNKTMGEDMSKADILALGLNWGTESNRQAVLGGVIKDARGNKTPAYTQQGVSQALSRLDARDWAFIQDIWDYENSFWAEMKETEERRRGYAPKKIEALSFTIRTASGEEVLVRGGYHPLRYDSRHGGGGMMSTEESTRDFNNFFDDVMKGKALSSGTRAGSTHERVNNHGKVLLLSLNTVDANLRELIRDLTIGDEINFVNTMLNSPEVKAAAEGTNNVESLKELRLWLTDAAVGELPAQSSVERALSYVRVGFTKSKLAFNLYVTALQLTGTFQSMASLGTATYMRGVGQFLKNPVANYKMVMDESRFMDARYGILQTWDKDVQDTNAFLSSQFGPAPTNFKRGMDKVGHWYFYPIAKFQSVVDVTTWMGAKDKGINELGLTSEQATLYADSEVQNAQTSGLFSDRSGIERGTLGTRTRQSQFVRLFTTLISYMLAKGNIGYEKIKVTDFSNPKDLYHFAIDMALLFMIEGMASNLLYGEGPEDEDGEITGKSFAGWTASVTAESMTAGIPFVRDYASAKYAGGATPVASLTIDIWKFGEQLSQMEADEAAVKSGIKVGGTLFHLPASQTNRFVEAMYKEDAAFYEYLFGVSEEE